MAYVRRLIADQSAKWQRFFSRAIVVSERARQLSGEWKIFFLRWLLLACIAGVILLDPVLRPVPSRFVLFLAAVAIYNLAMALIIYLNLYFSMLPVLTLVADVAAVLVLIHLPTDFAGIFPVFAVFPILIAALRFSWQVGLLTAVVFLLDALARIALAGSRACSRPCLMRSLCSSCCTFSQPWLPVW